jgi:hypothetical protein
VKNERLWIEAPEPVQASWSMPPPFQGDISGFESRHRYYACEAQVDVRAFRNREDASSRLVTGSNLLLPPPIGPALAF